MTSAASQANQAGLFSDLDFTRAISGLENPELDGWDFFVECQGTKIYRQHNKESGLYAYKTYAELSDIAPETCAMVYMDLAYRSQWDSYVKELTPKQCDGKTLIYWNVNFPFPLSNRDYVFGREYREMEINDKKYWLVLSKPFESSSLPPKKGVVRVREFMQNAVLCSNGSGGTKAFINYYDNPGGSIPTWLINWAAKTGVPQFLTSMKKACKGYPEYLAKQKNS